MGAGPLINLHAHTVRSDGWFTAEDVVSTAEAGGLTHMAITDHFATLKVRSMTPESLEESIAEMEAVQRRHPGIKALKGAEIDTSFQRCRLYDLPVDLLNRLDIVLFEMVQLPGCATVEQLRRLTSELNAPCVLAHNDLSTNFASMSPAQLAKHLEDNGLAVEINTAWPYARDGRQFYELAADYYRAFRDRVKVSIGTDVHRDLAAVCDLGPAYRFLRDVGLEPDDLVVR